MLSRRSFEMFERVVSNYSLWPNDECRCSPEKGRAYTYILSWRFAKWWKKCISGSWRRSFRIGRPFGVAASSCTSYCPAQSGTYLPEVKGILVVQSLRKVVWVWTVQYLLRMILIVFFEDVITRFTLMFALQQFFAWLQCIALRDQSWFCLRGTTMICSRSFSIPKKTRRWLTPRRTLWPWSGTQRVHTNTWESVRHVYYGKKEWGAAKRLNIEFIKSFNKLKFNLKWFFSSSVFLIFLESRVLVLRTLSSKTLMSIVQLRVRKKCWPRL